MVPGANVTLAGRVPVSSLITNEIKGALHPGDTTRLTAAPLGPNGESLVERKVTWQSLRPDIASVDAYGTVTAHSPGSTEIVAASEQQSARVAVSVVARVVTFSDAQSALRSGVDRFVTAVGEHDARQLAAVVYVESPDDQKNLDWLLEKVRSQDANFRVTRPQISRPSVRDAQANSDVNFTFAWVAPNGQSKERKVKFRAQTTKVGISSYTARWLSQFAVSVP